MNNESLGVQKNGSAVALMIQKQPNVQYLIPKEWNTDKTD